jgi:hypothetical protein
MQIGFAKMIFEVRTRLAARGIQIGGFLANPQMLCVHCLPVVDMGEHLPVWAIGDPLVINDDFGKFRPGLWIKG